MNTLTIVARDSLGRGVTLTLLGFLALAAAFVFLVAKLLQHLKNKEADKKRTRTWLFLLIAFVAIIGALIFVNARISSCPSRIDLSSDNPLADIKHTSWVSCVIR